MIFDTLLTVLLLICKLCLGESGDYKHYRELGDNCCSLQLTLEFRGGTHINSDKPPYIIYRLESLCKSDLAKVRLRLGNSAAASFQLNSSLVPGRVFNCHLELALDSSKLGFFVYFEDLTVTGSTDCEEDYVQFGRDILFITSYRSAKFCNKIQGAFPTLNTTRTKLPHLVTPMSARTYSEYTDQEMDIWLKLTLSPSSSVIKTVSFTVTPFLITCAGKHLGYRKCGKAGHCIREQFFCDGTVNCGARNSVWPSDETDCKTSSRAQADPEGSEWEGDKLYIILGPGAVVVILVLFVIIVYHKFPSVLNIPPLSKPYSRTSSGAAERGITSNQYEYHTGHIVPVIRRAAPPPPSSQATAPPLPRCPPPYTDLEL